MVARRFGVILVRDNGVWNLREKAEAKLHTLCQEERAMVENYSILARRSFNRRNGVMETGSWCL
jgi:hypothetical protein